MDVTVLNRQRARRVDGRRLGAFVERLAEEFPPGRGDELAVCLVSDSRMRNFQQRYRGRDDTTDVLSFAGEPAPGPEGSTHLGDIVISVPTAARQARDAGHTLDRELRLLAVHGYLHLLGFDHERDDGTMARLQRRLVRRLMPRRRRRGTTR